MSVCDLCVYRVLVNRADGSSNRPREGGGVLAALRCQAAFIQGWWEPLLQCSQVFISGRPVPATPNLQACATAKEQGTTQHASIGIQSSQSLGTGDTFSAEI